MRHRLALQVVTDVAKACRLGLRVRVMVAALAGARCSVLGARCPVCRGEEAMPLISAARRASVVESMNPVTN